MDRPLLPFVAIATANDGGQVVIESHYCTQQNNQDYFGFVKQKLGNLQEVIIGRALDSALLFFFRLALAVLSP